MCGHCACSVRARAVALFDNMGAGTKNRFIIPVKVCYAGCSILSIDFQLDPHALLDIKFSRNVRARKGFLHATSKAILQDWRISPWDILTRSPFL